MNNSTKIWLFIGTILIITGTTVFLTAMSVNKWNFNLLNTDKYVTNTYEFNDDFNNFSLQTDTADITFIESEDSICKVICYEPVNAKHIVSINDDSLTINVNDQRRWYNYIGISWSSPSITIYLPKTEYASLSVKTDTGKIEIPQNFKFSDADITATTGNVIFDASVSNDIKIKTSTGSIRTKNLTANALTLTATTGNIFMDSIKCSSDIILDISTGKTTVENVSCNNFTSDGSTGNFSADNLISTGNIHIERSTGNIKLNKSDASELFLKTSTGNVSGTLLSEKTFITKTSTGNISVPKSSTGGKCEIKTSTGNIKITLN